MSIEIKTVYGEQARGYLKDISQLSSVLFRGFPYLYDTDFEEDSEYLEQYFISKTSMIILVFDHNQLVACSLSMSLQEEIEEILAPFHAQQLPVENYLYIGAMMIQNDYKKYDLFNAMKDRHYDYAKKHGYQHLVFTTVRRDISHPACPTGYRDLEKLWNALGCRKIDDMVVEVEWPRIDTGKAGLNYLDVWVQDIK